MLIKAGANVNVVDKNKQTPIHGAALGGKISNQTQFLLLISIASCRWNSFDAGKFWLNQFLFPGRVETVKLLLENGADRNLLDEDGETALALAEKEYSEKGDEEHKQIVDMLKTDSFTTYIKTDTQTKNNVDG